MGRVTMCSTFCAYLLNVLLYHNLISWCLRKLIAPLIWFNVSYTNPCPKLLEHFILKVILGDNRKQVDSNVNCDLTLSSLTFLHSSIASVACQNKFPSFPLMGEKTFVTTTGLISPKFKLTMTTLWLARKHGLNLVGNRENVISHKQTERRRGRKKPCLANETEY